MFTWNLAPVKMIAHSVRIDISANITGANEAGFLERASTPSGGVPAATRHSGLDSTIFSSVHFEVITAVRAGCNLKDLLSN